MTSPRSLLPIVASFIESNDTQPYFTLLPETDLGYVYRGDTLVLPIWEATTQRGEPLNLVGATVSFTAKTDLALADNAPTSIQCSTLMGGLQIIDPVTGLYQVVVPPQATQNLTDDTVYVFDAQARTSPQAPAAPRDPHDQAGVLRGRARCDQGHRLAPLACLWFVVSGSWHGRIGGLADATQHYCQKNPMLEALDEGAAGGGGAKYASLHSAYSSNGLGNELLGGSPAYIRQAAFWNAASNGNKVISTQIVFPVPVGALVRFIGFWDNQTGGNFLGMSPNGGGIPQAFVVPSFATPLLECVAHGFSANDTVVAWTVPGDPLPSGLTEGGVYYVIAGQLHP